MAKNRTKQLNALTVFTGFGLVLFLCAYPYFLKDHYFTMTRAKALFFYGITLFFAVGCLIAFFVNRKRTEMRLLRKNPTELFLAIFMASSVVSWVAAVSPKDSLVGAQGRYMGLLTFLFIGMAYLCVSRFCRMTTPTAVIFGVSVIGMCLIALLQFGGLNPLHLYDRTKDTVKSSFMALLGNKDVYYSYLALAVPFSMYLSFTAPSSREKIFWNAVSFMGFTSIFACRSEGALLVIAVVFLILYFTKAGEKKGFLTFLQNVTLLFAAAFVIWCVKRRNAPLSQTKSVIVDLLIHPLVAAAMIAVCAVFYVITLRCSVTESFFRNLKRVVAVAAGVAACGFVGCFIYFTFFDRQTDLGALKWVLRYSNGWGSTRGFVWTRMTRLYFREFTLLQKLVGAGQETVGSLMQQYFSKDTKRLGMPFYDNAHNEFLQYLITQGLVGLLSYLFFVGNAVRSGFREGGRYQKAASLACVCYLAQSVINISQALTTPLFFVFLALTQTRELIPAKGNTPIDTVPQ